MNIARLVLPIIGAAVVGLPVLTLGQEKSADLGKSEYESKCVVCHGVQGKGDGLYAGQLKTRVADLTLLSRANGGVFPFKRVYDFIDGTETVNTHGSREMPIWGNDYRIKLGQQTYTMPYDPEPYVRARIVALAEYVYRLQAK